MNGTSPSHIQNLPNEIFLEIFNYLPHFSRCRAWAGLNFRIDSILRSTRSCIYISSNGDVKKYAENLQKWSEIIISVEDCRDKWTAYSTNYASFEPIKLRPFVNLRRFSQRENSAGQLDQICHKDFPYLECLDFGDYSIYSTEYSRILFDDQFPFLTSVSGVFLSKELVNDTTINTTIRHIFISSDYKANLFALLINFIKRLPNLTTLRVKTHMFKEISVPSNIITKICNLSVWIEHETTLEEIEFLLQINPVKRLYLEIGAECISGGFKSCNFLRLAQILNNCQTLKHVELRIWRLDERFDIEQIRQLSPWFTAIDLEYGYQKRKSLQTYHYRFEPEHPQFYVDDESEDESEDDDDDDDDDDDSEDEE